MNFIKCKANIINQTWDLIKSNVKFTRIPNKDELIVINSSYHKVLNIIYDLDNDGIISIVVEKINQ